MTAPIDLVRFIFTSAASRDLRRISLDLVPFGCPQCQSSPSCPPSLRRVTVVQVRDLLLSSSLSLSRSLSTPPPPLFPHLPGSSFSLLVSILLRLASLSLRLDLARPDPLTPPVPPLHSLSPCLSFSARPSSLSLRLDPSRPAPCSARAVLSVSLLPVASIWQAQLASIHSGFMEP
ncbi:hypothetical protein ACLOJK_038039 [Asimina triloba]